MIIQKSFSDLDLIVYESSRVCSALPTLSDRDLTVFIHLVTTMKMNSRCFQMELNFVVVL